MRPASRAVPATLLVVESSATALTLRRLLGSSCEVRATGGHLVDLPARREGIDLARGFEPSWELVRGQARTLSDLKRAARRADLVLLGTDPDREGEAIAWQLAAELGAEGGSARVKRVLLRELTPAAVARAVAEPVPLDRARAEAQLARRVIDRLIGFRLSARLSVALRPGLAAGRVQAAALRLAAAWRPSSRAVVGGPGAPPPPFDTASLLVAAAGLGLRPRRAMALAQQLYQGVPVDDGQRTGLLTYPRTASREVSPAVDAAVRALVAARHGPAAVAPAGGPGPGPGPRGAHEALRPTRLDWPPELASGPLREVGGRDLPRLYALAWERLEGSRMTGEAWHALHGRRVAARSRRGGPARLDDQALLEALVRHGVGRPSTLAAIGESLEGRGYLARSGGGLQLTPLGRRVVDWLERTFPQALDARATADMEARLDEVEAGRLPWRAAVAEIWTPLERPLGGAFA